MRNHRPKFGNARKRNVPAARTSGNFFDGALRRAVFRNAGVMRVDQDVGVERDYFNKRWLIFARFDTSIPLGSPPGTVNQRITCPFALRDNA